MRDTVDNQHRRGVRAEKNRVRTPGAYLYGGGKLLLLGVYRNMDENGDIEDSYLPDDLLGDTELKNLLDSIQERYDNLFLDENGEEDFQSENGFKSKKDEDQFYADLQKAYGMMKDRYSDKYIIEYNVKD